MDSQKWNSAAQFPVSTFMCLWVIYILKGMLPLLLFIFKLAEHTYNILYTVYYSIGQQNRWTDRGNIESLTDT